MEDKSNIKEGAKPVTGISGDPFSSPLYRYDESGRIIDSISVGSPGLTQRSKNYIDDPEKARIGDYYYDATGTLNVVPDSPTDIFNKWKYSTDTSLYAKPTRDMINAEVLASPLLSTLGGGAGAVIGGIAAKKAAVGIAAGMGVGAAAALLPGLAIMAVVSANQMGAQEKAYKDA